jgi:hypothetical protein
MAERKQWVVTLSHERPLDEVRRALADAGLEVEQVLEEIGVVTGHADPGFAEKGRAIPGVADVSLEGRIDLGPPGSPDTW